MISNAMAVTMASGSFGVSGVQALRALFLLPTTAVYGRQPLVDLQDR